MTIHKEEAKETSPLSDKPHGIKKLFRQLVPYGFCNEAKKQFGLAIPVFICCELSTAFTWGIISALYLLYTKFSFKTPFLTSLVSISDETVFGDFLWTWITDRLWILFGGVEAVSGVEWRHTYRHYEFLSRIMVLLIIMVSSMFSGHLGKIELDSVTLASSVINIIGISIGSGMSSGCDTLMSQTYGSKNMKRVGTILQRGILILMLCCFPCWAILINTEQVLLLCKQNPDIARLTQKYVMIFLPGLPAVFLHQLQSKYLQNQGIIWPQFFTGIAASLINVVLNAIFMYVFKLGVEGSAWANTVSQWTMALSLFLYIVGKKVYVETWGGWSTDCLQEWDIFLYLAIPSTLMLCAEWWSFEIGGFFAGIIGIVELGGQAIMLELVTVAATLPIGFGTAANIRVGIALGEGNIEQAKMSCKVVLYCTAFVCLLVSCTALALRNVIGYMFTTDRDVIALLSKIMLLFAPVHLCDGINTACSGILRGTGRQKIGAFTNVFGYYLIGIPVGLSLMFLTKLGVIGLWIGMLCPMLLQTGIHIPYIFCMNWHKVGEEAKIRAGVKAVKVPDSRSSKKDILKSEYGGTTMSDSSFIASLTPGEDHKKQLELKDDLPMETTNVVGEILSTKQLIVRRGLALLLCISLLMIGIAIKLVTTKKETQDPMSLD